MSLLADAYVQLGVRGAESIFGSLRNVDYALLRMAKSGRDNWRKMSQSFRDWVYTVQLHLRAIPWAFEGVVLRSKGRFNSLTTQIQREFFKLRWAVEGFALHAKGAINQFTMGVWRSFNTNMPFCAAVTAKAAQKISTAFKVSAAVIKAVVPAAFQAALQKAGGFIAAAKTKISSLASTVTSKLTGALNIAKTAAKKVGNAIAAISFNAIPFIGGFFNFIRGGIQSVISMAGRLTSALFTPLRMLVNFMFSWKGLLASLGASFSTAAVGRYIAHWTADAESAKVTFEVLLGSAGQAVTLLNQLQELADKTPLQLPEVRDAAKHLLAMGVSATQVTDTIRRLGDVSQGLGLDLNHVADIYGKVSQANRLTGEDMRRFRLNGIPIARELAIMLGKTTNEIQHMAHTGQIGFKEVEMVFRKMTDQGGIFFDLMKKKSQTLEGLFSTIQDSARNLAVFFGQGMAPAVKNIERQVIAFLDGAKEKIWPLRNQFRLMAEELASPLPGALSFITDTALPVFVEALKSARAVMHALGQAAKAVTQHILSWFGGLNGVRGGITNLLREVRFLAENWRAVWEVGRSYFDDFIANAKVTFTSLWSDFLANVKEVFSRLPAIFGFAVAAMGQILTPFIDSLAERIRWAFFGKIGKAPEIKFGSAGMFGVGLRNNLAKLFDNLPGFNTENLKKALSPAVVAALDNLKSLHEKFHLNEIFQPGFDKLRQLWEQFSETKPEALRDTTADLGDAMAEADKKSKAKFEQHGLVEFHRAIQKSIKTNPEAVAQQQRKEQIGEQKKTNKWLGDVMGFLNTNGGHLLATVFGP